MTRSQRVVLKGWQAQPLPLRFSTNTTTTTAAATIWAVFILRMSIHDVTPTRDDTSGGLNYKRTMDQSLMAKIQAFEAALGDTSLECPPRILQLSLHQCLVFRQRSGERPRGVQEK